MKNEYITKNGLNQPLNSFSSRDVQFIAASIYVYIDEKSTSTAVHSVDMYGGCIDSCKWQARLVHPHTSSQWTVTTNNKSSIIY